MTEMPVGPEPVLNNDPAPGAPDIAPQRPSSEIADPLKQPQYIVEGIILRRLHEKRIEGYTIEMAKEIVAALQPATPAGGERTCYDCGFQEPCDEDCPNHVEPEDPSPSSAENSGWHRELIDREPDHGQYANTTTTERLRQFAAYGDTAKGRIVAQLALTEIERLNGVAQSRQVTDEMVEAGAIGLTQDVADHDGGPSFYEMSEQSQHDARTVSRACLTAALSLPSTPRATPCDGADDLEHLDGMLDDRERES